MSRLLTCFFLILAASSGLYLYHVKHRTRVLDQQIEATLKAIESSHERLGMMRAEWMLLNDPERLNDLSTKFLALQTTAPSQFAALADIDRHLPAIDKQPMKLEMASVAPLETNSAPIDHPDHPPPPLVTASNFLPNLAPNKPIEAAKQAPEKLIDKPVITPVVAPIIIQTADPVGAVAQDQPPSLVSSKLVSDKFNGFIKNKSALPDNAVRPIALARASLPHVLTPEKITAEKVSHATISKQTAFRDDAVMTNKGARMLAQQAFYHHPPMASQQEITDPYVPVAGHTVSALGGIRQNRFSDQEFDQGASND